MVIHRDDVKFFDSRNLRMFNDIYLKSPAFVQNLALSAYGYKMYRDRFGGGIPSAYTELGDPLLPPNESDFEFQEERLQSLLQHCVKYVPHYQKLLTKCDWRAITCKNISQYLPVLTKKDILKDPESFLSTAPDFQKKLKLNTSGSSGTPMNIYSSYEARRINYCFYQQILASQGADYRSKSTTFAGRVLYKDGSKSLDRYDYYNNTQYLSTYFISSDTIERYISSLNKWQPIFIDAYPSALLQIRQLAKEKDLSIDFKPRFIITSSETLTPTAREKIEEFFCTKIIDHYGCTEMTVSAVSTGGQYFASPLYSLIELEHKYESSYSVITTGLLNFAMPLIRYEIGDTISTENPAMPYVFDSVEGRVDDVIITPEGRRVGRIDPAFKGIEGVELAQIIQYRTDSLEISIVLDKNKRHLFNEKLLVENIRSRTSPHMRVNINYQSHIEKSRNGKFKSVINAIK